MWISAFVLCLCYPLTVNGLLFRSLIYLTDQVISNKEGFQNMRSDPQILVENETAIITCVNPSGDIKTVQKGEYILPDCLRSSCSFYNLTSTANKWTVQIKNVKKIRDAGSWTCNGKRLKTTFIVKVVPKGEFLLVTEASPSNIYKIDAVTENYTVMKFVIKTPPVGLSFDPTTSKVYWSENKKRLIKTAHASENQQEIVTGTGYDAVVDGLAVDFIHRLLYYTVDGPDTINVIHLDNYDYRMTLIDTGLEIPRGIALLPNDGIMFWTDWGSQPAIEFVNMDGSNRNTFLSFPNGSWPNGLTVDTKTKMLYWVDAKDHTINAISLDKTVKKVLFQSTIGHFYDIVIMGPYLYVSDWAQRYLRRLRITGGNLELFGNPVLRRSFGLYAYNSSEVMQEIKFWNVKLSSIIHNITEGRQLEMVCEFNASAPTSSVYTWSKNGIIITNEKSKVLRKDKIITDDSGNYTCSNGNLAETMQLNVLYPPKVQSPSTIAIIESSTLVIDCNATANPNISSFKWTNPNGEQLLGNTNKVMTSSQLTIPIIDRSKSGNYICIALNTMIESSAPKFPITTRSISATTVNVLYVPEKDKTYDTLNIRVSTVASLSCSIDSNPAPSSYLWYNPNGTLISRQSKLERGVDQNGIYRCTMEIVMKPTSGTPVTKTHTKFFHVTIVDNTESSDIMSIVIISLAVCVPFLLIVTIVVVAVICYRKRHVSDQRTNTLGNIDNAPFAGVGIPEIAIVDPPYASLDRQTNSPNESNYESIRVKYHNGSANDTAEENQTYY